MGWARDVNLGLVRGIRGARGVSLGLVMEGDKGNWRRVTMGTEWGWPGAGGRGCGRRDLPYNGDGRTGLGPDPGEVSFHYAKDPHAFITQVEFLY